jgi:hypothetical protein
MGDMFDDLSGAFGSGRPGSCAGNWRYAEWPRVVAIGLLRVSRDPTWTRSLAEHPVTDVLRTCNHSWNDGRCLDGGAYDATCRDANVHVFGRPKTGCNRLHPQPALAQSTARDDRRHVCGDPTGLSPHPDLACSACPPATAGFTPLSGRAGLLPRNGRSK